MNRHRYVAVARGTCSSIWNYAREVTHVCRHVQIQTCIQNGSPSQELAESVAVAAKPLAVMGEAFHANNGSYVDHATAIVVRRIINVWGRRRRLDAGSGACGVVGGDASASFDATSTGPV
eukprot:16433901-Heterocapsa_arctica.AAC.1